MVLPVAPRGSLHVSLLAILQCDQQEESIGTFVTAVVAQNARDSSEFTKNPRIQLE